jgi:hypothetical protein
MLRIAWREAVLRGGECDAMLMVGIFEGDRAEAAAGQRQGRSRKMRIFANGARM